MEKLEKLTFSEYIDKHMKEYWKHFCPIALISIPLDTFRQAG